MTDIYIDKLYKYERNAEPCFIGIPVKKGELKSLDSVEVLQEGKPLPIQKKVTARHDDGSIKFMFLRFLADLPANKGVVLKCDTDYRAEAKNAHFAIKAKRNGDTINIDAGVVSFAVRDDSESVFKYLDADGRRYDEAQFKGPWLCAENGSDYSMKIGKWSVVECGEVCAILKALGTNRSSSGAGNIDFEIKLTAYANKPWIELSYRLINTTLHPLEIKSLSFGVRLDGSGAQKQNVRTCAASSNYLTDFVVGKNGEAVTKCVDAESLVYESNEHFAEVFYGTFFADSTDSEGGVCATVFQAQQNFPKAVTADSSGVTVMLVPVDKCSVVMESCSEREQKIQLHFH